MVSDLKAQAMRFRLAGSRSLFYGLRGIAHHAHIHLAEFGHLRRVGFIRFLRILSLGLHDVWERRVWGSVKVICEVVTAANMRMLF